ncbi:MAG: pantetheine-phosphate adenylyltransferase [Gemmataceae bacterium]
MPLNPRVAVYPGTFDPVHLGHMDMIRRGSRMFERLVVAVGVNPEKAPFFTATERVDLLERVAAPYGNVEVRAFDGLAVRFVREIGAMVMLRGLRTLSDMEYEFDMSLTNQNLDADIETVFLMAQVEHSHFSSTLIRQIGVFGGDLSPFLPPEVAVAVRNRVRERGGM